jgi:Family of unknown function (DUF6515)
LEVTEVLCSRCGQPQATVPSLPPQSTSIAAQGDPYYYSADVHYAPQGSSYAVPPPRGAMIPSIPDSCTTVSGPGGTFSYSNGVFYEPASKGYKIVERPPGLLIMSLPKGAVAVTVNNVKYREFGGVWYQRFYSGSDITKPCLIRLVERCCKLARRLKRGEQPEVASCYPNNSIFLYMLLRKMAGNVTCTLPSANHPY